MSNNSGGSRKQRESMSNILESLKLVLDENQGLKKRVIGKIKAHLALSEQSIFDVAKEKKNAKQEKNK